MPTGRNLTVTCPYNLNKYTISLKAWQRVWNQGRLETLVLTETGNGDLNLAQAGRYLLEDYPTEAIIKVTMTGLRREDMGLYPSPLRTWLSCTIGFGWSSAAVRIRETRDGRVSSGTADGLGPQPPRGPAAERVRGKFQTPSQGTWAFHSRAS